MQGLKTQINQNALKRAIAAHFLQNHMNTAAFSATDTTMTCFIEKSTAKQQCARAYNKHKNLRSRGKVLTMRAYSRKRRDKAKQLINTRSVLCRRILGPCSTCSSSACRQIFAVVRT